MSARHAITTELFVLDGTASTHGGSFTLPLMPLAGSPEVFSAPRDVAPVATVHYHQSGQWVITVFHSPRDAESVTALSDGVAMSEAEHCTIFRCSHLQGASYVLQGLVSKIQTGRLAIYTLRPRSFFPDGQHSWTTHPLAQGLVAGSEPSWRLRLLPDLPLPLAAVDDEDIPPEALYRSDPPWQKVPTDVEGGFHVTKQVWPAPTAAERPLLFKFVRPAGNQVLSNGVQSDHRYNRLVQAPLTLELRQAGSGSDLHSDTQQVFAFRRSQAGMPSAPGLQ